MEKIRPAAYEGIFYPKNPEQLSNMIDQFLKKSRENSINGRITGLIVPHAGYIYSGIVAASAYKLLPKTKEKLRIILLGPSHYFPFKEGVFSDFEYWETPLGKIKAEIVDIRKFNMQNTFIKFSKAHLKEHSLEVQLPFLQKTLENFTIIPIILGELNYKILAAKITPLINKNTIIIASSDLSHYYPYNKAVEIDKITINSIKNFDTQTLIEKGEACGKIPILVLLNLAKEFGWKPIFLDYKNSGDTSGIKEEVVGYASFAFYDENDK